MARRPCPACGRPSLARWRAATASDPQLAGPGALRARALRAPAARRRRSATPPTTRRCTRAAPTRPRAALARRLLAPLRGLAERDRMRFISRPRAAARGCSRSAPATASWSRLMRAAGLDARGIDPSPGGLRGRARDRGRGRERRRRRGRASSRRARTPSSSGTRSSTSTTPPRRWRGSAAGCGRGGALDRRGPEPRPRSRPGSAAIAGFIRTFPATASTSPRPAPRALLERTGFEPSASATCSSSRTRSACGRRCSTGSRRERDFAFRALKRDLGPARAARRARDLAVTAVAGPLLAPVAVAAELAAGLARRGGSIVVEARAAG